MAMTTEQALDRIREEIETIKGWGCIHQDEFGTHYAGDAEDAFSVWEEVLETLEDALSPHEGSACPNCNTGRVVMYSEHDTGLSMLACNTGTQCWNEAEAA